MVRYVSRKGSHLIFQRISGFRPRTSRVSREILFAFRACGWRSRQARDHAQGNAYRVSRARSATSGR